MSTPTNTPARNTKVMNRLDLTSRLIAKLKNDEAVVGGWVGFATTSFLIGAAT